jgi:hypothetical protein
MSPTEKRRTPRIQPYVAPCRIVEGSKRFPAYLADLSPLGARITCDVEPPVPGTHVVIEVRFGRQVRFSRLRAEVKWIRPGAAPGDPSMFGLIFSGVTAEEQRVLEAVVEEFRKRAEQLA